MGLHGNYWRHNSLPVRLGIFYNGRSILNKQYTFKFKIFFYKRKANKKNPHTSPQTPTPTLKKNEKKPTKNNPNLLVFLFRLFYLYEVLTVF